MLTIYQERQNNALYNTSYPLSPSHWTKYRTDTPLHFKDKGPLSLYIHVPFCQQLCSFCEYTRMPCPPEELQLKYIHTLESDVEKFLQDHSHCRLQGFDIGGGTPTSLTDKAFSKLMNLFHYVNQCMTFTEDFEPSIEASFQTVTAQKAEKIVQSGIYRLSLGVQSADNTLLQNEKRLGVLDKQMEKVLHILHRVGIHKINLDFMYGLKNQSFSSLQTDLDLIQLLHPEQVTLYELRTNMLADPSPTTASQRYEMYSMLYDGLIRLGYRAPFGQNTFSMNGNDMGVSSYLRHRMRKGAPYKGFGIAAQSMSPNGLAYNVGKNSKQLIHLLQRNSFEEEYTYHLPPMEMASKYIAVAAYSGAFSLQKLTDIWKQDAQEIYKEPLKFCLDNDLLIREDDLMRITRKGFKYYGAVFSLFYQGVRENE